MNQPTAKCGLCSSKKTFGETVPLHDTHVIAGASSRGQGIGKSILEDLLNQPQVQSPVLLTTVGGSKGFYLKFGFEEIGPFAGIPLCV